MVEDARVPTTLNQVNYDVQGYQYGQAIMILGQAHSNLFCTLTNKGLNYFILYT